VIQRIFIQCCVGFVSLCGLVEADSNDYVRVAITEVIKLKQERKGRKGGKKRKV